MKFLKIRVRYGDYTYKAYIMGQSKHYTVTCTSGDDHAALRLRDKYWGPKSFLFRISRPSKWLTEEPHPDNQPTKEFLVKSELEGATHVLVLIR